MEQSKIEKVLRMAIRQGGEVAYNPDMYKLGFADNITPSSEFNEELKKYGRLNYEYFARDEYSWLGHTWSSFEIDERGKEYIKELDRERSESVPINKNKKEMKYSEEFIISILYKDYILLMEEELSINGFTDYNGRKYKVRTDVDGNFVSDFSREFIMSIKDPNAIAFLKTIGLLNNGRCPLTGLMLHDLTKTTYTSEQNPNIHYDISMRWKEYIKTKRNWGCFISIFMMFIGIVLGFMNGFNLIAYTLLGIGALATILFSMYGAANFGNNVNRNNLANKLGINDATLLYILKAEKAGMSKPDKPMWLNLAEYGISLAEFTTYKKMARD